VRILDRYLLGEFIAYLAMGLLAFVGIFLIVDVFEKIDTFVDAQAAPMLIIRFYLSYIPVVVVQILPVAVLLASLLSLGRFARHHELTAMRVAGQSLFRIFQPILLFAVGLGVATFILGEAVVPAANQRRKQVMNQEIKHKSEPLRRSDVRYIGRGGRIYVIGAYDVPRATMRDVVIQEFAAGALARRIDARQGQWQSDHWELRNGYERIFAGDSVETRRFDRLQCKTGERPDDFAKEERDPDGMGFAELRRWIERFRQSGGEARPYLVDMHLKLAMPFVNVITVLIGASLSTRLRRGGTALGFGLSLIISFLYYSLIRAGQALGHGGTLPPVLAAWAANLIFGALGLILLLRAQRGH
jgi:lipopolysaccharide export system permease protein